MTYLQTWLKRLEEPKKKDNRRVLSKYGWKLKFMHCTVASAKKGNKQNPIGCGQEHRNYVDNGELLLLGAAMESINKCEEKIASTAQYLK